MKSDKWNRFKNGYSRLITLTVIMIVAGLGMAVSPEKISLLVIRILGAMFVIDGFNYGVSTYKKYTESKK